MSVCVFEAQTKRDSMSERERNASEEVSCACARARQRDIFTTEPLLLTDFYCSSLETFLQADTREPDVHAIFSKQALVGKGEGLS